MSYHWDYLTFTNGQLYLDNGRLYGPTRTMQFATEQQADDYLRSADLRATIR